MKQWALVDPENNVRSMSNSPEALEDLLEGFADEGEGWDVVRCGPRFWSDHPELNDDDG